MRLLNTTRWELREFISDDEVPQYAILSHTWEAEEISFQQWESRELVDITHLKGYKKIKHFGEEAARNGFEWGWVDTCCIDKKSSAELTEAINAMFRWYKTASVCYVYLVDAPWDAREAFMNKTVSSSRWFTRGWTLQELIAPRNLIFYSAEWRIIANKLDLCNLLASVTGIDEHILDGGNLGDVSVARRMSWASHRQTSRKEDIAYCLLGIFEVNIPLIYGEGMKAFTRLQEAIMNSTHDQSLFAWGKIVQQPSGLIDDDQEAGNKPILWKDPQHREPLLGLFAPSPASFSSSGDIAPVDHGYAHFLNRKRPPTLVNGGVVLDLVIYGTIASTLYWDRPAVAVPQKLERAVLLCRAGTTGSKLVALALHQWGDEYYSRTKELLLVDLFVSHFRFQGWTKSRHLMPFQPFHLRNGDLLIRRWETVFESAGVSRPTTPSGPSWRQRWGDRVLRMEQDAVGDEEISFFFKSRDHARFAVTLKRVQSTVNTKGPIAPLLVGVSPYAHNIYDEGNVRHKYGDWRPLHGTSFANPEHHHTMQTPTDTWTHECHYGPVITFKVERMFLDGGRSGAVDVVDCHMYRGEAMEVMAKLAEPPTNNSHSEIVNKFTSRRADSDFSDYAVSPDDVGSE